MQYRHHSERKKCYQSQIMGACKKMLHPILNMFFYLTIQMPILVSILILRVGLDQNLLIGSANYTVYIGSSLFLLSP